MTNAPTSRARATTGETELTVPRMFDWCTIETIFVRSLTISSRFDRSRRPSSVRPNQRSVAPVRWQASCQGTMFEWCSISVMTTSSPGPRRYRGSAARPLASVFAARFRASEAFLAKTTSARFGAGQPPFEDREVLADPLHVEWALQVVHRGASCRCQADVPA